MIVHAPPGARGYRLSWMHCVDLIAFPNRYDDRGRDMNQQTPDRVGKLVERLRAHSVDAEYWHSGGGIFTARIVLGKREYQFGEQTEVWGYDLSDAETCEYIQSTHSTIALDDPVDDVSRWVQSEI